MGNHFGAILPVRLNSERLPGKALMDLGGKPVIHHLLTRLSQSRYIDRPQDIVVCTTEDAGDDPLAAAVECFGASVFRGARDDIIARFHGAISAFGFDAVIQVNGDNPLTETRYMDACMDRLLGQPDCDIVTCPGLPIGAASCAFSRAAMAKVMAAYETKGNDTGFIYFFTRTGLCRHVELAAELADQMAEAWLTLDYQEDLDLLRRIVEELGPNGETFDLRAVLRLLKENPKLLEINGKRVQEYMARTREKAQLAYRAENGSRQWIEV